MNTELEALSIQNNSNLLQFDLQQLLQQLMEACVIHQKMEFSVTYVGYYHL